MIDFDYDFDERHGYTFHIDYCANFFDTNEAGSATQEVLERDFVFNLADFLNGKLDQDMNTAFAIAKAVFDRMSDSSLHYHTPVHVLGMLLFAYKNGLVLEDWEQLAIWFHAAIVMPRARGNASRLQSAGLMRAIIPNGLEVGNGVINRAERAILHTGQHDTEELEGQFSQVLDLDLSLFASSWTSLQKSNGCLTIEDYPVVTLRAFDVSRKRFYEKLLDRPSIYRSKTFQEKFEKIARGNLQACLQQLD